MSNLIKGETSDLLSEAVVFTNYEDSEPQVRNLTNNSKVLQIKIVKVSVTKNVAIIKDTDLDKDFYLYNLNDNQTDFDWTADKDKAHVFESVEEGQLLIDSGNYTSLYPNIKCICTDITRKLA